MKFFALLPLLFLSGFTQAQLSIEHAQVRAMPPGLPNTAAFLSITNQSNSEVRLVEATSSAAKKAEFHSHSKDEKGVMRMAKEPCVDIPAGETFIFESGGHHIMLMGLNKTLMPGDVIPLTLEDSNGKKYNFSLPVVSVLNENSHQDHSHHHH